MNSGLGEGVLKIKRFAKKVEVLRMQFSNVNSSKWPWPICKTQKVLDCLRIFNCKFSKFSFKNNLELKEEGNTSCIS